MDPALAARFVIGDAPNVVQVEQFVRDSELLKA
jgi:hypothetical protein